MEMTDLLLDIYEDLIEKNNKLENALEILGIEDPAIEFLSSTFNKIEISILLSMGGTKENWDYITSDFFDIFYRLRRGEVGKKDLKEEIKIVIDNNLKGEIPVIITRG